MTRPMKAEPGQFQKSGMNDKTDDLMDRKEGIKENSKKDVALDKKRGIPEIPVEFQIPKAKR